MKLLNSNIINTINNAGDAGNFDSPIHVDSPNIRYENGYIESDYDYTNVKCSIEDGKIQATPMSTKITFRTSTKIPKLGMMLVGWGGNNGTTVTGAILANKLGLSFITKEGLVRANYFGSLTQSSTIFIGIDERGKDVYIPMNRILPMVNPNDILVDGWDISSLNIADSMKRAKVIDYDLQRQLAPHMEGMKPRPAIFDPKFVAANQATRADNILKGSKASQIERIRKDIREFKESNNLDKIIVLWTANTERYVEVSQAIHGTAKNLLDAIERGEEEISPSTMYAVASILEDCAYINGSPQNTFVPGLIELAEEKGVFIGGDDFKSGQTKFKSVIVDFLVNAGIKPSSIVSYNHLGNNDGYNLSSEAQFKSKEISKSGVVDDMVESNKILYPDARRPDHCVVIKYVPYVGDSKRAMDEYISELMLGGKNTIVVHNTCEDSLLASPIILDLVILTELCQRVTFKIHNGTKNFISFHPVQSILAYLCKAPLVEPRANVINALSKQRAQIENILRALLSLPPVDHMYLQNKVPKADQWFQAKKVSVMLKENDDITPLVGLISNNGL